MSCIVCAFCFQIEYVSRSTFLIDQALKSFRETALSLSCIERNIQLPPQIEFYASLCANDSILFCQDINTVEGLNRAAEADLMIRRAHGDRSRETRNRVVERRQDAMSNEEERDVSFEEAASSLGRDGKKKAVENRQDKLKLEHPDEDVSFEEAASSLGRDGKKKAVENRQDKLKLEHPDEDVSFEEAASSFGRDGKKKAVENRQDKLKLEHPDEDVSFEEAVLSFGRDGKKKAVENRQDKLKLEHPDEDITLEAAASSLGRDAIKKAVENRRDKLKLEHPDEDITLKAAHSSLTADGGRGSLGVAKKPDESNTQWMMLESLSLVSFQPRATQTKSNLITVLHYHEFFGTLRSAQRLNRFNDYYTAAKTSKNNSHEFPIENPLWKLSLSKSRPEGVSNKFTQEEFNATAADRKKGAERSAKRRRKAA